MKHTVLLAAVSFFVIFPLCSCTSTDEVIETGSIDDLGLFTGTDWDWGEDGVVVQAAPEFYTVQKGDTIFGIARKFGLNMGDIKRMNRLSSDVINAGTELQLIKTDDSDFFDPDDPEPRKSELSQIRSSGSLKVSSKGYQWPVEGRVISKYFPIKGMQGIDIQAVKGKPVHAAKAGTIVFRGVLPGLGNVVFIEHKFSYVTLYAHLSRITVNCKDTVSRGDVIGYTGESGSTDSPLLHFRIYRDYRSTKNPLDFLP